MHVANCVCNQHSLKQKWHPSLLPSCLPCLPSCLPCHFLISDALHHQLSSDHAHCYCDHMTCNPLFELHAAAIMAVVLRSARHACFVQCLDHKVLASRSCQPQASSSKGTWVCSLMISALLSFLGKATTSMSTKTG